jgi:hypothetical protein
VDCRFHLQVISNKTYLNLIITGSKVSIMAKISSGYQPPIILVRRNCVYSFWAVLLTAGTTGDML